MAVAIGTDDSVEDHVADTLAAGAGLCDERAVRSIVADGPRAIEQLLRWGVPFDRADDGALRLGLEGAHRRRRVVHAQGDTTGALIMQTLTKLAREAPSIRFIEGAQVLDIGADGHGAHGVTFEKDGAVYGLPARQVVLATGSACALWRYTSVPAGSWGQGLVLAERIGAALRHLEFVQFHPTALDCGLDPLPLISEALRGEGAKLVLKDGTRFIEELAPRDIVARAIFARREAGAEVFLDARGVHDFLARFPTIAQIAQRAGLDPQRDVLPVRPVAHYHMGGIASDLDGRSTLDGLWACGEAACTGLHGANRLASNSLLEGLVMGLRIAAQMEGGAFEEPQLMACNAGASSSENAALAADVREVMNRHVGVVREESGLVQALSALEKMTAVSQRAQAGLMIARAALVRKDSVGAHCRSDENKQELEKNERCIA
jgi:L-aspartate oxidase